MSLPNRYLLAYGFLGGLVIGLVVIIFINPISGNHPPIKPYTK